MALASTQGQAWGEDSMWLGTIDISDMIGGGQECHYESWLIVICTEHVIVLMCIIALIIYLNRVNKPITSRISTPPPPPSPTPAPRATYTPISSPFIRQQMGNSAF